MNGRQSRAVVRRTNETFDAPAANKEMTEKLRRDSLRRQARKRGLELRQTSYGYALINSDRQRIDGRNDLTLDEVVAQLEVAPSQRRR